MNQAALPDSRGPAIPVERSEFDLLIEKNADGIVVIDADGTVLFANPAAEQMFGRNSAQLVGSPIGVPVITGETTEISLLRPDGDTIEAEMRVVETIWRERPALLATLRDITSRRLAEERLRQAQKMEAVGRLTAGIAHDFNNLLTVAMGNLELLQRRPAAGGKPERLIEATLSALTRAERLTAQLLAFSRKQHLAPEALDLNRVLLGMEDLLRRVMGPRIEMAYTLRSRLPPALADRNQLETALLNVASNARDAMPNGGRFVIETGLAELDLGFVREHPDAKPGRYLTVVARDTGEGMPPHVLRRAFEPFFSTKEPGKGTGLGLAMVYGFAQQSGGHVIVDSRSHQGTSVTIYLPFAEHRQTGEQSAPQAASLNIGCETVLVVEDDAAVRAIACAMLEDLGYRIVEAPSADTALQALEARPDIDLVFSDIVMPGELSGIDLARELIARRPELPIVLTSGYSSDYSDPEGILSLVGFVPKPYHQAELSAELRKALVRPNGLT